MDRERFEELVKQGIDAIPQRFLEKMNNVDIIIEDEPTQGQIEKLKLRKDVKLFGLYEGVPQTKRGYYSWVLPDKITIFKKPIEEVAFSDTKIKIKKYEKNCHNSILDFAGRHFIRLGKFHL